MRFLLIFFLATILPAISVLGQRGGRGGGRGGFNRPGGNLPNTFVTATRPAPTQGAGANPAAAPNNAPGGGAGGGGAGAVQASLIPPFGITAGVRSSDGTANCVGDNNVNIP